jgi:hypothetical protein
MIQNEGVDSLSEAELRQACRERGMLGLRSVEDMRKQVIFQKISQAYHGLELLIVLIAMWNM